MVSAILHIKRSSRGKLVGEIELPNNKRMSCPSSDKLREDLDGQVVQVSRVEGVIHKVVCGSLIIYERLESQSTPTIGSPVKPRPAVKSNRTVSLNNPAHAPYNFVPLNDQVVLVDEPPAFNTYHSHRFTGYIDLDIETRSPLFIGSDMSSEFFAPNGKICIPGSSLRGMLRNLAAIVSWSKFQQFADKSLYFRAVGDKSSLGNYYRNRMVDPNLKGVSKYKINAGYLAKKGHQYGIYPARKSLSGKQFRRYNGSVQLKPFQFKPIENGHYIIRSGEKVSPKNRDKDVWEIYSPDKSRWVPLEDEDLAAYRDDKYRKTALDYLAEASKSNTLVPCFYLIRQVDGKPRVSFGHTALFRVRYDRSIGELVPLAIRRNDNTTDLVESLFGRITDSKENQSYKSRVFVMDAHLVEGSFDEERIPQTLSGPKPTSFQLYLEQINGVNLKRMAHYDSANAKLRGYKLYWHRDNKQWFKKEEEYNSNIDKRIRPLQPGARFRGRIWFENLSNIELGLLLFVINLPKKCLHKIGMGKPLGLGSVRLSSNLYIENIKDRYSQLLVGWEGETVNKSDSEPYMRQFENYILQKLDIGVSTLWKTERLKELEVLLEYSQKPSSKVTSYMKLQSTQFKDRHILPRPSEVDKHGGL